MSSRQRFGDLTVGITTDGLSMTCLVSIAVLDAVASQRDFCGFHFVLTTVMWRHSILPLIFGLNPVCENAVLKGVEEPVVYVC